MSIEAMKLALEWIEGNGKYEDGDSIATALRQAIDQAEQIQPSADSNTHQPEPVVWMYQDKSTHEVRFQKHMSEFVDHSKTSEVPLYGEPLANHELQCVCGAVWCGDEMVHLPNKTQQRKPLTSKEIRDIEVDVATNLSLDYSSPAEQFTRAIEAAHGIKGEA